MGKNGKEFWSYFIKFSIKQNIGRATIKINSSFIICMLGKIWVGGDASWMGG